jgi:hypothetical protein
MSRHSVRCDLILPVSVIQFVHLFNIQNSNPYHSIGMAIAVSKLWHLVYALELLLG